MEPQIDRLIVVAGLKRSGTTWMFNVVRLALPEFQTTSNHDIPPGDVILKTHWWNKKLAEHASLIFSSWRDPKEVRESLIRFEGGEPAMGRILNHYEHWDEQAHYRMKYEDLLTNPREVVAEILSVLGSDADHDDILTRVSSIQPPEIGIDWETLYHAGHFTKDRE